MKKIELLHYHWMQLHEVEPGHCDLKAADLHHFALNNWLFHDCLNVNKYFRFSNFHSVIVRCIIDYQFQKLELVQYHLHYLVYSRLQFWPVCKLVRSFLKTNWDQTMRDMTCICTFIVGKTYSFCLPLETASISESGSSYTWLYPAFFPLFNSICSYKSFNPRSEVDNKVLINSIKMDYHIWMYTVFVIFKLSCVSTSLTAIFTSKWSRLK